MGLQKDVEEARRERSMALRCQNALQREVEALRASTEDLVEKEEARMEWEAEESLRLAVREAGRGHPVAENFVRNV